MIVAQTCGTGRRPLAGCYSEVMSARNDDPGDAHTTPSNKGWAFQRTAEGWIWMHERAPGDQVRSVKTFPNLLACVDDAARNGLRRLR